MWLHACAAADTGREACGLVALDTWRVFPLRNVASDPRHYYSASEEDLRAAIQVLDGERFAVYHSHIEAGPEPSAGDRDGATYPDQFILSIKTGKLRRYKVLPDGGWRVIHDEERRA